MLPELRPLPPAAIELLQAATDPDSESLEVAVEVIFATGDPAALEIFANQARNAEQDVELVQGWMRDPMLRHRAEPAVIRMSIELLKSAGFDSERKSGLAEATFDYRPKDWYLTPVSDNQSVPEPPSLDCISPEGRTLLKELAAVMAASLDISTANKTLADIFVSRF